MPVKIICRAGVYPKLQIPYLLEAVQAGFPSPAQDYVEQQLDLNELCIKHPSATYFVRATGDSMIGAGIHENDILVVDRSLTPNAGDIIIAGWNGELTVKELQLKPFPALISHNDNYPIIRIPDSAELDVFGVVSYVLHGLR
ncbi:MAG: translesion error-prone DNA polymerase V autoproteolytic subunit [Idiomarina sp.]|nr:translesion error-prone DNA polymerase V autoproteolytic subunit [Idiomarina sp.]